MELFLSIHALWAGNKDNAISRAPNLPHLRAKSWWVRSGDNELISNITMTICLMPFCVQSSYTGLLEFAMLILGPLCLCAQLSSAVIEVSDPAYHSGTGAMVSQLPCRPPMNLLRSHVITWSRQHAQHGYLLQVHACCATISQRPGMQANLQKKGDRDRVWPSIGDQQASLDTCPKECTAPAQGATQLFGGQACCTSARGAGCTVGT